MSIKVYSFAKRLRELLDITHMTQTELAKQSGISKSSISRYLKGDWEAKQDAVYAIAKVADVSEAWLMGYDVPMLKQAATPLKTIGDPIDYSKYNLIPILGRIPAGLPLLAEENIEGYTLTDLNGGAEYFALRVTGDSMNAIGIMEGHLLHVRRQPEVENGEVAVVMVGDEDATVKRFYSTENTVTLMPQSTNPTHKPQIYDTKKTKVVVLGKVVKVEFRL